MYDSPARLGRTKGAALLCAALVLLVGAAYGLASRAYAQSSRRLEGQVLNGTAGAPPGRVANLDVTLFQMGAGGPVTHTVQTDAQGRFIFTELKADPNSPFFARVDYEGIHYFTDTLSPDIETSKPLTLTVYETQTLPANFQIDRVHLVLDVGEKSLSGIELLQVTNPTDRAFMLAMPLPQDVSAVQFNDPRDEFRAMRGADGSIAFPILPTTQQVLFGVQMSTQPPDYTLNVNVPVKIGRLNVLVAQTGGVGVTSAQLTPGPVFTPQSGTNYWQLNGDNIPAGSKVAVAVANLPGADNSGMIRNVVLGMGGLAALTLLALPLMRRRGAVFTPPLPPFVRGGRERSPFQRKGWEGSAFATQRPPVYPNAKSNNVNTVEGDEAEGVGPLDSESESLQVSNSSSEEEEGEEASEASERLERLQAMADLDDAFAAGQIPEDEYRVQRAMLKAELMMDAQESSRK